MKSSDTNQPPRPDRGDPRDALVDALLREHARLGRTDDESLLAAVHARTVARPAPTRVVELPALAPAPRPKPRVPVREWLQIAAVVALSVTLLGLFLSNREVPRAERHAQTFQLVSRPLTAVAVPSDVTRSGLISPAPTPPRPGDVSLPGLGLDRGLAPSGDVAFPEAADPVNTVLLAEFSVSAETLLQPSPGRLVYEEIGRAHV